MSEHTVEKDAGRLAALLWSLDWPGKAEQGQQVWETLDAELLPKRLYLSKAERLIEAGVGFVERAWDEAISIVCDCGDFDGHPGDCAATPLIHAACVTSPSEGRA